MNEVEDIKNPYTLLQYLVNYLRVYERTSSHTTNLDKSQLFFLLNIQQADKKFIFRYSG